MCDRPPVSHTRITAVSSRLVAFSTADAAQSHDLREAYAQTDQRPYAGTGDGTGRARKKARFMVSPSSSLAGRSFFKLARVSLTREVEFTQ